jgi:hypothetical protein
LNYFFPYEERDNVASGIRELTSPKEKETKFPWGKRDFIPFWSKFFNV